MKIMVELLVTHFSDFAETWYVDVYCGSAEVAELLSEYEPRN